MTIEIIVLAGLAYIIGLNGIRLWIEYTDMLDELKGESNDR